MFPRSFSDHEAVCATIRLRRGRGPVQRCSDFRRSLSIANRPGCVKAVRDALEIVKRSQECVKRDKMKYGMVAGE